MFFAQFLSLADASSHYLPHSHHHRHADHLKPLGRRLEGNGTGSLADAEAILAQAMIALEYPHLHNPCHPSNPAFTIL